MSRIFSLPNVIKMYRFHQKSFMEFSRPPLSPSLSLSVFFLFLYHWRWLRFWEFLMLIAPLLVFSRLVDELIISIFISIAIARFFFYQLMGVLHRHHLICVCSRARLSRNFIQHKNRTLIMLRIWFSLLLPACLLSHQFNVVFLSLARALCSSFRSRTSLFFMFVHVSVSPNPIIVHRDNRHQVIIIKTPHNHQPSPSY